MDFELEQIFAKVSGENVENPATRIVSESDKAQIDFAFEQIFSGQSVLEWMTGIQLIDAWKVALDKLRNFIFSIQEQSYVVDYLHHAVFAFRKKQINQTLQTSIHANEYMQYPKSKYTQIEQSAKEKIQDGIDIIKSLLSVADYQYGMKHNNTKNTQNNLSYSHDYDNSRELEYERTRK